MIFSCKMAEERIVAISREGSVGMMRALFLLVSGTLLFGCQASEPAVPNAPITSGAVQSPAVPALPAGAVSDIDFKAYSTDLANVLGLEMGETRLDAIDKIRLYFSPEPGTNMVNLTSSTVEQDDGSVMLFARNNLPDDAVFAEEVYAVFSGPGEANKFNQTLEAYGLRVKCRRGDNAMEWTTELCP